MTFLLIAQLVVHTSAPPLSPEEAVRILRASKSIADRTGAIVLLDSDAPASFVSRSRSGDGPFGSFLPFRPTVLFTPAITFRIPHRRDR